MQVPAPAMIAQHLFPRVLRVTFKGISYPLFVSSSDSGPILELEKEPTASACQAPKLHWRTGLTDCLSIYHWAAVSLSQYTGVWHFSCPCLDSHTGFLLHSFYPPCGGSPESLACRKVSCLSLKTVPNDDSPSQFLSILTCGGSATSCLLPYLLMDGH